MHLKVTVEEGRKAELKQQSLDAHYSLLWVFLREDTLLMWSKEESLLKGIHLNKTHHGMASARNSKVREPDFLAGCVAGARVDYFPGYKVKRRSRAEPHFEAAALRTWLSLGFLGGFFWTPRARFLCI